MAQPASPPTDCVQRSLWVFPLNNMCPLTCFSFYQHWAKVASTEEDAHSHLPLLHPVGLPGSDERAVRNPGGQAGEEGGYRSIQLLQWHYAVCPGHHLWWACAPCIDPFLSVSLNLWKTPTGFLFWTETAMGKRIYAQSNADSEYVRCVYKWVLFSISSFTTQIKADD